MAAAIAVQAPVSIVDDVAVAGAAAITIKPRVLTATTGAARSMIELLINDQTRGKSLIRA